MTATWKFSNGVDLLALPRELEQELDDARYRYEDGSEAGHPANHELTDAIEDAINAKLAQYGVDEHGGWCGEWSAEEIVRDAIARYGRK